MFICVICHVTRAMWPIELVFIINIYITGHPEDESAGNILKAMPLNGTIRF